MAKDLWLSLIGLRAASMRRPARVKPFLGRAISTADCRPTGGTSNIQSLLLRKVFLRLSILPMADQREAHNAAIPNSQFADSPHFHPHSLWSYRSGARWVSSIGNWGCRLGRELKVAVFQRSFLACVAVTRSRRFAPYTFKLFSSVRSVDFDFAMTRKLRRPPTANEAGCPAFAPRHNGVLLSAFAATFGRCRP